MRLKPDATSAIVKVQQDLQIPENKEAPDAICSESLSGTMGSE